VLRHLVPRLTVQYPTGLFLVLPAPLFEEERHVGLEALVAEVCGPWLGHRTCAGAGLAANYHPVNALEV